MDYIIEMQKEKTNPGAFLYYLIKVIIIFHCFFNHNVLVWRFSEL